MSEVEASELKKILGSLEWFGGHLKSMTLESRKSGKDKKAMESIWQALAQVDGLHFLQSLKVRGDARSVLQGFTESQVLLPTLRGLDLRLTELGDTGLAPLVHLSQLSALILWLAQVTDAGLAPLASLSQLSYLDFARTPVTDAGLEHLVLLTQLSYLDLRWTEVSGGGIAKFREQHPRGKKMVIRTF